MSGAKTPSIAVHLMPYDPHWGVIAAEQIARLRVLEPMLLDAQHIGSTSVPGLIAKPVVDLIGLVVDLDELDARQGDVEALGYTWHGEFGLDGRRFCTLDDPETGERIINLHLYEKGSIHPTLQLSFRDYLRAHDDVAMAYAEEKRRAMALFPDNSTLYAAEKGAFIREILDKALSWNGMSGEVSANG